MKHVKYLLMAFMALSLALSVQAQTSKKVKKTTKHAHTTRYQCPMKCEGEKTYAKPGKCPVCKMDRKALPKDATAATYQCPMKCEGDKTYAAAGNCPVCKMKLKKNEGQPHSH